jgi:hypothetical protein
MKPAAASRPRTKPDPARLAVTDQWVLFARPRSQHVVLRDIDRLRLWKTRSIFHFPVWLLPKNSSAACLAPSSKLDAEL